MSKTQEAVDAKSDKSQNQETGPETGLKCDSQTSTEPSVTQEVKAYEAQSKDPNSGEVLEDILEEEKLAEMDLKEKREKYGLENEETLKACLRMLDSWIGLYKLRPMDELLKEVLPIAKEKFPELYPRFIQSQAFLRFKQFKFRESINLFKHFQELVGPSPELLENMGHTHNTLGEFAEAAECFETAIKIVNIRAATTPDYKASDHLGGLYLGKGTTLKRQEKYEEALECIMKALESFKTRFGEQDHSLVAKTLTSAADVHVKMGRNDLALPHHLEAVRLFRSTCGVSPLTANALYGLGRCYEALNDVSKCKACYDEALSMHVGFDTLDMTRIVKLLVRLFNMLTAMPRKNNGSTDELATRFAPYSPILKKGHQSILSQGLEKTDDAAVYFKFAGEFFIMGGMLVESTAYFNLALNIFKTITHFDCSGLISACEQMLKVAKKLKDKKS